MPNPLSNRKKVRGWKRRLRELDAFRRRHEALDPAWLGESGVRYVKVWLDPWSRLVPRNPPAWFQRRILAAFLQILSSWRRTLDATGEPYYLRLWLFDPEFHQSQVVAAVGSRIPFYENTFDPAPTGRGRPPPRYDDPEYDLDALAWRPCLHTDVVLEDAADAADLAWLHRRASRVERARTGQALFLFDKGLVWVGALPPA